MTPKQSLYVNPSAQTYTLPPCPDAFYIRNFHQSLPSYAPSPFVPLPNLAQSLGVKAILVKDESCRLGLPSFKILGASWGIFRALAQQLDQPFDQETTTLHTLGNAAKAKGITLFAATDGNHGRAVARMASILGITAEIYVPASLDQYTQNLIASETGCTAVVPVAGDYDCAVRTAHQRANACPNGVLVQDMSFEGYSDSSIPAWIVDGYATMLHEIDMQLCNQGFSTGPTHLVTPVGVGSLAHAVVAHYKSSSGSTTTATTPPAPITSIVAVEPTTAACLHASFMADTCVSLPSTPGTIMSGLDCGTVSLSAWPVLRAGINACMTVSDREAHEAVEYLASCGVKLGPCGAAGVAALRRVAGVEDGAGKERREERTALGLRAESVVVVLGTEGLRPYPVPVPGETG